MRTNVLRRTLGVAVLLLAAWPAEAQDGETSAGRTPGWSVTPGVTVGAVYDSNVGLANAPADTGRTQSDRLVLVQPSGELEFVSPRTQFSTGYQGNLRRYVDLDQLNGFDQRVHASFRRLATKRLAFSLSESYGQSPTTDELELNGVPFSRTGSRRNSLGGRVDARLTKFTTVGLSVDHTWVSFERTGTLLTGGSVSGGRVDLSRRVRERVSVGLEYGVRFAEFDEGTRQVTFHDAGGTVQVGLGERTSAGFASGLSYLDDRSLGETRRGPYVRADVTHGTEHATFGASFDRTFVPTYGFGGSSRSQQLRGFARMPFAQNRMHLQGSASWRKTDPFLSGGLSLETATLRSTLGYSAARHLRLEVFYALTRQDTGVAGGNINRQRAGAQVVLSQPMRIP